MDTQTENLRAELELYQAPGAEQLREEFEAAATAGYSEEAVEVFEYIDSEDSDRRDRLLMRIMLAEPEQLRQLQIDVFTWYFRNARAAAKQKF